MSKKKQKYQIGRIFVERDKYPYAEKEIKESTLYFTPEEGGKHLQKTLQGGTFNDSFVDILITPGAFINTVDSRNYSGPNNRFDAQPEEIDGFIELGTKNIQTMLESGKIYKVAKGKVNYISVGCDVRFKNKIRAELVALIDVNKEKIAHWTGKSYPTSKEESKVIQVTELGTHFRKINDNNVLILGCHDINVFHPRARANAKKISRVRRWKDLTKMVQDYKPTIVIHHPHVTIKTSTWRQAWKEIREENPSVKVWASGICYVHDWDDNQSELKDVLKSTRSDEKTVLDIKLIQAKH